MAQLDEKSRQLFGQLRAAGVLADVQENLIDLKDGVIMVTCSDGDQMYDMFSQQAKWVEVQRKDPRIHLLALNGGAIHLGPNSPTSREDREDKVIEKHIEGAVWLKNIQTVILYTHTPCGLAKMFNLGLYDVLEHLVAGKERLKFKHPELKVACFVHVDREQGLGKRTYFVSRDKWRKWRQETRARTM